MAKSSSFSSWSQVLYKSAVNKEFMKLETTLLQNVLHVEYARLNDRKGDLQKRWFVDVKLRFEDLTSKRKPYYISSKNFPTEGERRNFADMFIRALLQKYPKTDKLQRQASYKVKVSLLENLADVLLLVEKTNAEVTYRSYRSNVNLLSYFLKKNHHENLRLVDFTPVLATQFSDYLLLDRKNENKTRNSVIGNLRHLMDMVIERTPLIKDNPFKELKFLKEVTTHQNIAFTPEHQKIVMDYLATRNPDLYFFSQFVYFTFTRIKETRMLKIEQIDFERKTLTIEAGTIKSRRQITKIIPRILFKQIKERGLDTLPGNYYVFSDDLKPGLKVLYKNKATNDFRKILKKLDLYKYGYSLYSFRHTGADRLVSNNPDLDIVDLQLHIGHSDIKTTMNYLKARKLRFSSLLKDRDW